MKPTDEIRKLIIDKWIDSGGVRVTKHLLHNIQMAIAQILSDDALSPASIARILADEGAELVHPDVLEADMHWRQSRIRKSRALTSKTNRSDPLTLEQAYSLLQQLERARRDLADVGNDRSQELRDAALNEKAKAHLLSVDPSIGELTKKVQGEIAEWFLVWLQTPDIFDDWFELRVRSREFRDKFPDFKLKREPSE